LQINVLLIFASPFFEKILINFLQQAEFTRKLHAGQEVIHGFLKVNFPFVSFIDGTRPDERRSVHHQGLFTPPLELPSPLLA
jgi:hypothetical protein